MDQELRSFKVTELRASTDGKPRIEGYAAVFGQLSDDLGGFREVIMPGAFADTLQRDDQRALWNHETGKVLGRRKAGTLELAEDTTGLRFTIYPPDTQTGRDALELVRRGDVDQMSFAFSAELNDQTWQQEEERGLIRSLRRVQLYEVSPVTFPAYPQTSAAVRAKVQEYGQASEPPLPQAEQAEAIQVEAEAAEEQERQRVLARRANRKRRLTIQLLESMMEEQ